jgi:hypothetical protein
MAARVVSLIMRGHRRPPRLHRRLRGVHTSQEVGVGRRVAEQRGPTPWNVVQRSRTETGTAIITSTAVAPIAQAVRPVLNRLTAAGISAQDSGAGDRRPSSPVELLSMILDLAGSLELESHLQSHPIGEVQPGRDDRPAADALTADEIAAAAIDRFERLQRAMERRLAELPSGRSRIHDADRVYAALRERGVFGRRNLKTIGAIGREAAEMYLIVLSNLLDRARSESRMIRLELGPAIAARGSHAADVVAFDTLLERAGVRFTSRLLARIPPALGADFVARLQDAVRGLPESPELDDVRRWYADDGWVSEFHRHAMCLLRATIQHERTALTGLLAAVTVGTGVPATCDSGG